MLSISNSVAFARYCLQGASGRGTPTYKRPDPVIQRRLTPRTCGAQHLRKIGHTLAGCDGRPCSRPADHAGRQPQALKLERLGT